MQSLPTGGSMMERATDGLAVIAVITGINPEVYKSLSDFSEIGALLMPILGCVWLGVQIWSRVFTDNDSKHDEENDS